MNYETGVPLESPWCDSWLICCTLSVITRESVRGIWTVLHIFQNLKSWLICVLLFSCSHFSISESFLCLLTQSYPEHIFPKPLTNVVAFSFTIGCVFGIVCLLHARAYTYLLDPSYNIMVSCYFYTSCCHCLSNHFSSISSIVKLNELVILLDYFSLV